MFHFLPIAIRYDGSTPPGGLGHGYQVHVGPMYSDARGSVKITTTDPRVHPALRFNYLSTEQDRREWVEAVRSARKILNQPAFDAYSGGETSPGPSVSTDEEILDWVARDAETALHPSCTCRMGIDDMSVVDPASITFNWRSEGPPLVRLAAAEFVRYIGRDAYLTVRTEERYVFENGDRRIVSRELAETRTVPARGLLPDPFALDLPPGTPVQHQSAFEQMSGVADAQTRVPAFTAWLQKQPPVRGSFH